MCHVSLPSVLLQHLEGSLHLVLGQMARSVSALQQIREPFFSECISIEAKTFFLVITTRMLNFVIRRWTPSLIRTPGLSTVTVSMISAGGAFSLAVAGEAHFLPQHCSFRKKIEN